MAQKTYTFTYIGGRRIMLHTPLSDGRVTFVANKPFTVNEADAHRFLSDPTNFVLQTPPTAAEFASAHVGKAHPADPPKDEIAVDPKAEDATPADSPVTVRRAEFGDKPK